MTTAFETLRATWRRVGQLHENERLIAAAQLPLGGMAVWGLAFLLLPPNYGTIVGALIGAVMIFPDRRHVILSLGALMFACWTIREDYLEFTAFSEASREFLVPVALAFIAVVALLGCSFLAARAFRTLPRAVRRRPLVWLHALLIGVVALGWALGPAGAAWQTPLAAAIILMALRVPFIVWTCSYLLIAGRQNTLSGTTFFDHLFWLAPTWSFGDVPYGKGWVNLHRNEVKELESFARSQLAGLKLLALAVVWKFALAVLDTTVLGRTDTMLGSWLSDASLALPGLDELLRGETTAAPLTAWASVYVELVRDVLEMAATGHVIVGTLRLLGFHVFRNTYKPLLAESVVEFWGRYFYYFKELLVDSFFYPTFLRVFKKQPRLRIFTAVFAAACLGNQYFHHLFQVDLLVAGQLVPLLTLYAPRWVYCIALAIGVWVSMERQSKLRAGQPAFASLGSAVNGPSGPGGLLRLRRIAGVWTFFAMLQIWIVGEAGIGDRLSFMLSLIGL